MDDKKKMDGVLGRYRLGKKKELVFEPSKSKEEVFKDRLKVEEEEVNKEFKRRSNY